MEPHAASGRASCAGVKRYPAGCGRPPGPSGPSLEPSHGWFRKRGEDAFGEFESVAAILTADARAIPRPHAVDEVPEFHGEHVPLAVAVEVQDLQVPAEEFILQPRFRGRVHAIDLEAVLPHVLGLLDQRELPRDEVDPRVAFRRPDAQAALRVAGDAARGYVRDAAVGELQPRIDHVLVPAEHRGPHRGNRPHRAVDERE